jgi:hypothetical protein
MTQTIGSDGAGAGARTARRGGRALRVATAGLMLGAGLTACRQTGDVIDAAAQSPLAPIVLKIVHGALVAAATDDPTPLSVLALLGVFATDKASAFVAKEQKIAAANNQFTLLEVDQIVKGRRETSIFKVTTEHKLVVAMNGKFIETIQPNLITISPAPNTDSIIVVTDADAGQVPYIRATVNMSASETLVNMVYGDHSLVDLDTGKDKNVKNIKDADLKLDLDAQIETENGAKAALWTLPGDPSLATCESLPASQWTDTLFASDGVLDRLGNRSAHNVWCVRTKEGRYGAVSQRTANINYAFTFDYVLWEKPGDH